MKIHNIYYLNLLWKAVIDPLIDQVNKPPLLVIIDNKEEWEVEDILKARNHRTKVQYKVKWVRKDENQEWYDASGFNNFPEIVKGFYMQYLHKSQPYTNLNRKR